MPGAARSPPLYATSKWRAEISAGCEETSTEVSGAAVFATRLPSAEATGLGAGAMRGASPGPS